MDPYDTKHIVFDIICVINENVEIPFLTQNMSKNIRLKPLHGSPLSDVVMPGQATFAMVEKQALANLDELIQVDPHAARLIVSLIRLLEAHGGNVVVISNKAIEELLGVSRSTAMRALRLLKEGNWVQRIRIGGANALAINNAVAWVGPRGAMAHAAFTATVVASRSEQDAETLQSIQPKKLPAVLNGEIPIQVGSLTPPAQEIIPGTEPY